MNETPTFTKLDSIQIKHAVKTALAGVAAMAITDALGLKQGYWAVITALLIMQTNLGGSIAAGWQRLLGTAVGALAGVAGLTLFGPSAFSLGVSVFATIAVCTAAPPLRESSRLAAVTAAVVLLVGGHGEPGLAKAAMLGLERFLEIVIGVAIGLAVTFFVWPSRAKARLAGGIAGVQRDLLQLFEIVYKDWQEGRPALSDLDARRQSLRNARNANRALLGEAQKEPGGLTKPEQIMISLMNFQDRIFDDVLAMAHAARPLAPDGLGHKMLPQLARLRQATGDAMSRLAHNIELSSVPDEPQDLATALSDAGEGFHDIRRTRATFAHDLDEVLRFFSFYFAMRSLAEEIAGMAVRVRELAEANAQEK